MIGADLATARASQPPFDEASFSFICELAMQQAGLLIRPEKATMVFSRLNKRIKTLGLPSLDSYCALLRQEGPEGDAERSELIGTLTTNVTSFLREPYHFETFRNDVLPPLIRRARNGGRVRLWCAGCSSGEEAYTIAMCVLDAWPDAASADLKLLASDIDDVVLRKARAGIYSAETLEILPQAWRSRYFHAQGDPGQESVREGPRKLISFRKLNLIGPWPFAGKFDVIFCRNVVIYFDQDTQNRLWRRFDGVCSPGGTLFVGHSERVESTADTCFELVEKTTYRKPRSSIDAAT